MFNAHTCELHVHTTTHPLCTHQLLHSLPHLLHGPLGVLCGLVHGQLSEDLLHHGVLQLVLLQGLSFDQCPQSIQLIAFQSTIL